MLCVRNYIEDMKSQKIDNKFIIKLMIFAKSEFSSDCISIGLKPSDEDLLNHEIQPSAKPMTIDFNFANDKYKYCMKFIKDEINFFEQWFNNDKKEYDECLCELMMEEYEKHGEIYLQMHTNLCSGITELLRTHTVSVKMIINEI